MTAEMEGKELRELQAVVEARFAQSMSVPEVFFTSEAGRIETPRPAATSPIIAAVPPASRPMRGV